MGRLQPHQHEIPNQIRLAECPSGGIHALENQLRIVLLAAEGNVHNEQLGQSPTQWRQVGQRLHLLLEEREVLLNAQRGLGR